VETWLYRRIGITFTAYQANVRDAIQTVENEKGQAVDRNFARFRRRGLEAELQLKLLTGFSAFGGVTVNHVTDLSTGDVVYGPPRRTYDVRLTYRHPSGSSAGLVGHYAWYRVNPGYYSPRFMFTTKDRRFLWDLKVAHTFPIHAGKIGVTLSVYNLFNTPSWWISPFPLPPRWVEGGIRYEL
jgi:outer membrane cobalamin receptor